MYEKLIGKVVAVRGYSSGVNVGRLIKAEGQTVFLTDSFFMRSWTYENSCGSFHSLAVADITGGDHIVTVHSDSIIMDAAHVVVCVDETLEKCKKYATVK